MATFQIETDAGVFEIEGEGTEEQMQAFLGTPEGQALLNEQINALPEPEPETPQALQNLSGAMQGLGLTEGQADELADSGFSRMMLGVGREAQSLSRGIQQIAGTPQEAAALALVEERDRKIYEELDEQGIGFEDLGQAVPMLATIIAPGGNVVQGLNAVGKGLNALAKLGSTLGAQAALVGAIEGGKATTLEESRAANAASGAAATLVGGKLVGGLGKSLHAGALGKMLTIAGLGGIMKGEGGRRAAGGIMGYINRNLLGRQTKDVGQELSQKAAAAVAGPESRRIVEASTKAQIELAKQSGGLAAGRSQAWDAFLDIVKGPASPKTGKRSVAKSLGGGALTKAQKEAAESGLDVIAERNRIVGTLMEAAKRPNPNNPQEIFFDTHSLETAWRILKDTPEFGGVYKTKTGALNSKAQAVESFIDNMLKQGSPSDPTVTVQALTTRGLDEMRQLSADAIEGVVNATQKKVDSGFKLTEADVRARTAAAALATTIDQNEGWGESLARITSGDTWEWIDVTSSIQEQLQEIEDATNP